MSVSQTIKKWVFWAHFFVALVVAIFVFIMSATGFLLTYERQIKELDEMRFIQTLSPQQKPVSTDVIVKKLQQLHPDEPHIYVRWVNRAGAAIPGWAGPNAYLFDPVNANILRQGEGWVADTFHWLTDLHRYLLMHGEQQIIGKTINNYANLALIFLLVSGVYLWLPKRWSLKSLRKHALLAPRYLNKSHRRHQWHLVFGIWCAPVLLLICLTATLFHFEWANKVLYGFYGQDLPKREKHQEVLSLAEDKVSYQYLFEQAQLHAEQNNYQNWYSMWMEIGDELHQARFYIDKSIGHRQSLAYSLYFDTRSGEVTHTLAKRDWTPGDRAWGTARFLHTGEHYGFVGQTIAGLVSLLCCILVYTGVMLAFKRLKRMTQNA
ncbi:PepSY-associated TM helix domain-containing protein [Gayadomonas joobiniege]|uniref:PepSY-associated TM helix domain-containing protein n=1 Tax=Gayadomonas joobiniege TaxID=1234606 RepID=UPI000376DEB7|nr:PepSY-associated TM helix domain-containing protein [Gayadomonas joobiniege]